MKRLLRNTGVRQSLISIVGNFLATGISAVALILITRLLGPEKFGIFSVGFSIVLILTKLNEAGLNTSLVKLASATEEREQQNDIFSLTLRYKLILSSMIALAGILSANWLAQVLNFPQPQIIRLAFTVGLATVYYEHLLSMLQSVHRFTQLVMINAIQATTKLVGAVCLLGAGMTQVWPVFTLYIAAPMVPLLFAQRLLPSSVKIKWPKKVLDQKLVTKVSQIAKHSSVALISAGIIENIDVLFLQKYLTTYETGLYGGVSRIAMMFALIAYSLGNVLNARVAKYQDKTHLQEYLRKALAVVGLAGLGFLAFIPLSQFFIWVTIGPEYLSGTWILLVLTASSFLAIAAMPFIALFYSFEADWYFSVSGLLQLAIVLVGNAVFVPIYGLEAAAWTRFATRLFLFIFTFVTGWYLYYRTYVQTTTT